MPKLRPLLWMVLSLCSSVSLFSTAAKAEPRCDVLCQAELGELKSLKGSLNDFWGEARVLAVRRTIQLGKTSQFAEVTKQALDNLKPELSRSSNRVYDYIKGIETIANTKKDLQTQREALSALQYGLARADFGSAQMAMIDVVKNIALNNPTASIKIRALEILQGVRNRGFGSGVITRRQAAIAAVVDSLRQLPEEERGPSTHGS